MAVTVAAESKAFATTSGRSATRSWVSCCVNAPKTVRADAHTLAADPAEAEDLGVGASVGVGDGMGLWVAHATTRKAISPSLAPRGIPKASRRDPVPGCLTLDPGPLPRDAGRCHPVERLDEVVQDTLAVIADECSQRIPPSVWRWPRDVARSRDYSAGAGRFSRE